MINEKKVLAIIPARGGSKGVPRKNIRIVGDKPLIAWTIEEAKKSQYIDRLIISSDDDEIIQVAKEWGCEAPFVRPKELAEDHTPGIEPVLHALNNIIGYDYVILLQPTSPFRKQEDIDNCIRQCILDDKPSCVSITKVENSPYWMFSKEENGIIKPFIERKSLITRRQESPDLYELNGAIYVAEINWLKEKRSFINEDTTGYDMPKNRSLDVDTEFDLLIAELYIKNGYL